MSDPARLVGERRLGALALLLAIVGLVGASAAQGGESGRDPRLPEPLRDPLAPVWNTPSTGPAFQGFPVFPSRLPAYGTYPDDSSPGRDPSLGPAPLLPLAAPEPPGWPSWLGTGSRAGSNEPWPYSPDRGLLIQNAHRVWWRSGADEPFVPLFFHDKVRPLGPGAEVEVRQAGEFEVLLYGGTSLVALGPTSLRLVTLAETEVEIALQNFTRVRVSVSQRQHSIGLPDGSTLRIPTLPPDTAVVEPVLLLLTRADEPGWLGGRATIFNASDRDVVWQNAFGEITLPPAHQLTFFLRPPSHPVPAALVTTGVEADAKPASVSCRSTNGGDAAWCGAHFVMPPGTLLHLDPLQGQPFAAQKPSVPAASLPTKTP